MIAYLGNNLAHGLPRHLGTAQDAPAPHHPLPGEALLRGCETAFLALVLIHANTVQPVPIRVEPLATVALMFQTVVLLLQFPEELVELVVMRPVDDVGELVSVSRTSG